MSAARDDPPRPGRGERSLRRALEILGQQGLRIFWFSLLGETVYRRVDIGERPIDATKALPAHVPSLQLVLLTPDGVEEFLAFRNYAGRAAVHARLARGDRCFLIREQGRIVHARWTAVGHSRIDYLDCDIRLADDAVYLYEAYTAPEARGRSISPLCSVYVERYYGARGYRKLVWVTLPENLAAHRGASKVDGRVTGRIGYCGAGSLRWRFFNYTGKVPPLSLIARQHSPSRDALT